MLDVHQEAKDAFTSYWERVTVGRGTNHDGVVRIRQPHTTTRARSTSKPKQAKAARTSITVVFAGRLS